MKVLPVHLISRVSPPPSRATLSAAHRTHGHTHGVVNSRDTPRRWRRRPPRTRTARARRDKKTLLSAACGFASGARRVRASALVTCRARATRRSRRRLRVHPRGVPEPGPRQKGGPAWRSRVRPRAGRRGPLREADRGDGPRPRPGVPPAGRGPLLHLRSGVVPERDALRGERRPRVDGHRHRGRGIGGYGVTMSGAAAGRAAPGPRPTFRRSCSTRASCTSACPCYPR